MRAGFAVPLALMLSLVSCSPDGAAGGPTAPAPSFITGGQPDVSPELYPFVGALLWDFNDEDGSFEPDGQITEHDVWCSLSLVARNLALSGKPGVPDGTYDVALTAAHCVLGLPDGTQLYVSFDQDLRPGPSTIAVSDAVPAPFLTIPAFQPDLGLLFLAAGSTPALAQLATLPPASTLSTLAAGGGLRGASFVNVGYGTTSALTGPPRFDDPGQRLVSTSRFMGLQPTWLGLQMNGPGLGQGGDCYGDSGSPKLLAGGDGHTIYATTTTGDALCRATSWDYRLDTPAARGFLGQYLPLP